MYKRVLVGTILIAVIVWFLGSAWFAQGSMTKQQRKVLDEILVATVTDEQIKAMELSEETARKFPAVDRMFKVVGDGEGHYVFMVSPVGYLSPINMMVVIDAGKDKVMGIRVMQHDETPGWGEWLMEDWFIDRFPGKSVDKYLQRVILEAEHDHEIVQITSATISTQAVLNGVNAAMGTYREVVREQESPPVPLKVEGFITESQ
jgi:electron transport complex protein RnfG